MQSYLCQSEVYLSECHDMIKYQWVSGAAMAGSNTPIFNDLLCFFSGKLRVISRHALTDAVARFYSSDEVKLAYDILQDCLSRGSDQGSADGRGGGGINFDSKTDVVSRMHDILSKVSANDMPFFVCRDVNNIPTCSSDDGGRALPDVGRLSLHTSSSALGVGSEDQRGAHEGQPDAQAAPTRSRDVVEQIFSE